MRLQKGFVLSKAGEDYVAVATGEASKYFNGLIRNNATASYLFEQLQQEKTEEDLVQALLTRYEVGEERARNDVHTFIVKLQKEHLLESELTVG
jgi:hypothetical protein